MPWTIPNLLLHDKPVPLANVQSHGRINTLRRSCSRQDVAARGKRLTAREWCSRPYPLSGTVTFRAVVRGTEHQVSWAARFFRASFSTLSISNSSSLWPVSRAATSHRGRFPLPDHVSDGTSGLQYLGRTFGYLRRGARSVMDSGCVLPGSRMISTRFNFVRRLSN